MPFRHVQESEKSRSWVVACPPLEAAEALTQVKGDRVQGKQGPEHPVEEKLGAGPTAGSPWAEGRAAEARAGPPLQK